ncbi:MAG: hypothetical protein Q7R84_03285, partial [bacterium]|nr:hypothetical protein [bacterium]
RQAQGKPTGIFPPMGDLSKGDKPSSPERIKRFKEILENEGVSVTQRHRFGEELNAACGQLAGKDLP